MIRSVNREIMDYFKGRKVSKVTQLSTGPRANLWDAVKVAKNKCPVDIPLNLTLGGVPVAPGDVAGSFDKFFSDKVKVKVTNAKVNASGVFNGKCKLIVQNQHFMRTSDVECCLADLKNKKCKGFDRIPVCALFGARVNTT